MLVRKGLVLLIIVFCALIGRASITFDFPKTSYGDKFTVIENIVLKGADQYFRQEPMLCRYRFNEGNWHRFEKADSHGWADLEDGKIYLFNINGVELESYENTMQVQLSFNGIDTLKGESVINYCGPFVSINKIAVGEDEHIIGNNEKIMVLNTNKNIYVHYEAYPFCTPDDATNYDIKKVQYKINNSQWAWGPDYGYTSMIRDSIAIKQGVLKYGLNTIRVRAIGDKEDEEISEEFKVFIYYFNFNIGELPSKRICPVDDYFKLQPTPSGGYFSGAGIAGKSNAFNPAKAGSGTHTITYHMLIDHIEYTLDVDIEVIEEPRLIVQGDLQVCANQTDVEYFVLNPDKKFNYFWEVNNYQNVIEGENGSSLTVQWAKNIDIEELTTGTVTVTAIPIESGTTCTQSERLIVDINPEVVPDKAELFFADDQKQLLVCTDTLAVYFKWYKNDKLIKETTTPYLYLDAPAIASEVFYVLTSFSTGNCYTRSFDCTINDVSKSFKSIVFKDWNKDIKENGVFKVFPVPVQQFTHLIMENQHRGGVTLRVYDIKGNLLSEKRVLKTDDYFVQSIDFSALESGAYIIDLDMDSGYKNKQRIIKY